MKLFEVNQNEAKLILKEGITHIDDQKLPIEKFLHVLKNLKDFEITEKVDGANLKFGLNMAGRFFTSRMGKEGKEYFSEEEWGKEFKDTAFRSAHLALEQQIDEMMKAGLEIGDIVEVEILFGTKPNAIPYWPNQIIFLRAIHGDPDIDNIANVLEGQKSSVEIKDVPYTLDGETIERTDENHTWTFSQVQNFSVDVDELNKQLSEDIKILEEFLYAPNIANFTAKSIEGVEKVPTNLEVLAMRGVSEVKEVKELVKDVIDGERDPITGNRSNKGGGLRYKIKEILLDKLVRTAESSLGPSLEEGGWVEGVVLKSKNTGEDGEDEIYKVVDKDIFTTVNEFNHQVRKFLTAKHKGVNTARETAGILGNLLRDMAEIIGYPELGTNQAKNLLKKLGTSRQEIVRIIISEMDLEKTKVEWIKLIDKAEKLLKVVLEQYKDQYQDKEYTDKIGRSHKYDKDIHNRTLQTFAGLFMDFSNWKTEINEANSSEGLIMILIGDKI
ncbi:hypothetical protein LCGC14_0973330 [marine sediment metagenome]|uniref:RNA ligase domain-containing protein n=1 Tax=marine sediment metagenome TaxID=412755 RepID=A0A0F9NX42_9ZZZZ